MAQALMIGPNEEAEIKRVIEYAQENVVPLEQMKALAAGKLHPDAVYDHSQDTILLPPRTSVTFTIEEHPPGRFRHISISDSKNETSHPAICNEILRRFGFQGQLELGMKKKNPTKMVIWMEAIEDGKQAVNIMEPIVTIAKEAAH